MDKSEKQIIQQLRRGNKSTFNELFEHYYSVLSAFALKYLNDIDDSREIVQDLFVSIYEKRESLEIKGSLKAYLFQSVKNKCLNYLRKNKTAEKHHMLIQQHNSGVADLSDQIIELEMERKIYLSIENLAPKRKGIFIMSRINGKTNRQIADELEISIRTVETQISGALKEIRTQLGDYLDP